MIQIEEVPVLHEILIERFDGSVGIRDRQLLESALSNHFKRLTEMISIQQFMGEPLP
jgi:hypothetical protein